MRKHLAIAVVIGLLPMTAPAFFVGRADWSLVATATAALGLISVSTVIALIVFFRLEPTAGQRPQQPQHASRV